MADTISNPSLEPLFFSVDPMSLILSQNSDTYQLKLLLDGFCGFERGPRYDEYSRLRESKLKMKRDFQKFLEEEEEEVPKRKQVRFEGTSVISRAEEEDCNFSPEEKVKKKQTRCGFSPMKNQSKAPSSSLAQSVPDFSAVLRKENRRPVNFYTTPPPPLSKSRNGGVLTGSGSPSVTARGSKSASAGEKKNRGMMGLARKSYASVEDLKKISMAAASAINGGGGRKAGGVGGGRTILGYRQVY